MIYTAQFHAAVIQDNDYQNASLSPLNDIAYATCTIISSRGWYLLLVCPKNNGTFAQCLVNCYQD